MIPGHGCWGSLESDLLALKKPLLGSSCLLPSIHRCWWLAWISWIFIDLGDLRARVLRFPKQRHAGPEETFTPFQVVAIIDSSMCRLHRFIDASGWLAGGWLLVGKEAGLRTDSNTLSSLEELDESVMVHRSFVIDVRGLMLGA